MCVYVCVCVFVRAINQRTQAYIPEGYTHIQPGDGMCVCVCVCVCVCEGYKSKDTSTYSRGLELASSPGSPLEKRERAWYLSSRA